MPLDEGDTIDHPCPGCGLEETLTFRLRLSATDAGRRLTFSLAGAQMKLPTEYRPFLVCSFCGFEIEGTFDKDSA